jgi:hypothetical protein
MVSAAARTTIEIRENIVTSFTIDSLGKEAAKD